MFQLFDDAARRVVVLASEEARELNHDSIDTRHILLGLIRQDSGAAAAALTDLGVEYDAALAQVEATVGRGAKPTPSHVPFTEDTRRAMEYCLVESQELGHNHIGTEHILLALTRNENDATRLIAELGVGSQAVRERVLARLG